MGKVAVRTMKSSSARQKFGRYGRATTIESERATLKDASERKEYERSVARVLKVADRIK